MIDLNKLEDLAEQIRRVLPDGTGELQREVKANIRVVLEAALARMNLVTREEFDVQTALLARTRAKLEELEHILDALERRTRAASAGSDPTD